MKITESMGHCKEHVHQSQCFSEPAKELRDTVPDCLMEVAHSSPHLILRCWRCSPNLISAECSLNLSLERLIKLLLVIRSNVLSIQLSKTVSYPEK